MLLLRLSTLILLTTLFFACTDKGDANLPEDPEVLGLIKSGEELAALNCYSCHHPEGSRKGRLAPPLAAVKSHYLNEASTLAEFTEQLTRFVSKPSPVYSKMPGARRRFGLMPALPLPEEELRAIAAFIYYGDLEAPEWLEAHLQEEKTGYAKKGKDYALQTKAVLGKQLMAALNTGGPEYAIPFCNTRAIPLTDSSANAQNVQIRRVSDRPRNPTNAADSLERKMMAEMRKELAAGQQNVSRLTRGGDAITGYYPILTNGMCLQCHGEKEAQVTPATLSALEALYPDDQATGYRNNQLRGLWVVTMPHD